MKQYQLGDVISDRRVIDSEGHLKLFSEQMGKRGLLIYVLRGTWCAICVSQIHSVNRNYHRYSEKGVESVFISPEEETSVNTFRISAAQPLRFGLHADPQRETAELFVAPEDLGTKPAVYLVDTELRVVWRYIGEHSEDRPSHQQTLNAIDHYLS